MNKEITQQSDFIIIGAGIVGLALAREIRARQPRAKITLLEKENSIAAHSSGRNSGVLHAGFYYTPDSLKARFSRLGNAALTAFCREHGLPINPCGKVVVAQTEEDLPGLAELEKRAKQNDVSIKMVDTKELAEIEPNAKTVERALFSPTTSTVDPGAVCRKILDLLAGENFSLHLKTPYKRRIGKHSILAGDKVFEAGKIINAAGLYADKIAADFDCGEQFTILPFKGLYLKHSGNTLPPVRTNIYPVPNLANPFLGVHLTVTVDGQAKLGPTAIPAFWRENYSGLSRFNLGELTSVLGTEMKLMLNNSFNFRDLAFSEMKKYRRKNLLENAGSLVHSFNPSNFSEWSKPGIRAQLLDKKKQTLIQDFVIEANDESIHVLNAVSPAFTCSMPFAAWLHDTYIG